MPTNAHHYCNINTIQTHQLGVQMVYLKHYFLHLAIQNWGIPHGNPCLLQWRNVPLLSVLDCVKVFIPAMQQAQEELRDKMAEELDIEVVDDAKPHIQMVCFVWDCHGRERCVKCTGREVKLFTIVIT